MTEDAWKELRESARLFAMSLVQACGLTGDEADRVASRVADGLIAGTCDALAEIHGPHCD